MSATRATWAALAVLALSAAPARADQAPAFTVGPAIAGQALVGAPMQVVAEWSGVPAPSALYEWERCDATGLTCAVVDGACGATYVPAFEDFGNRLRARVDLWNSAGAVVARTPLSDLVLTGPGPPAAATAAAAPRASSCAAIVPPAPPVLPASVPSPAPASGSLTPPVAAARPAYMRPFPIVRIRGYSTRAGARITLLSIRGPRSARVRAVCAGAGCPSPAPSAPLAPPVRLRAFERFLPAGTLLQVRVTDRAAIGKYTSFRILAARAPRRADRCLVPGRWAPAHCPAS